MNTNIFKDILHDLKEQKLWLVAVPLLVMIAVVPMFLKKPGEPSSAAVAPPVGVTDDGGPQLALTRASTTGFARPPRVNDDRLDPFASRATSKTVKDAAKKLDDAADGVIGDNGAGGGTDGGGTGGGGSTPPTDKEPDSPEPNTEPDVVTETDDLLSILVTNPAAPDAEPEQISDIRTLSPLVDPENPFLVYVGKTSDESATFLVSADVTVSGDGSCSPSPTDCRTLTLGIGQTAEFTLISDQSKKITITVLDIETKDVPIAGTEQAAVAARLERKARRAGAKALKSVLADEEVVKALVRQKIKIRQ